MKKWVSFLTACLLLFSLVPPAFAGVQSGWEAKDMRGLATDSSGRLYVADVGGDVVRVYNNDMTPAMTLGVKGEGGSDNEHLSVPKGVAVDQTSGEIYVLDYLNNRIQVFNHEGDWLRTIDLSIAQSNASESITLDRYGHIFVTDQNYKVYRMNTDGSLYRDILLAPQILDRPMGVATDSKGNLYVSQYFNHIVLVYAYDYVHDSYTYLKTIGEKGVAGTDNSHFNNPWGVYVDENDSLYVTDKGNNRVQVYNSDGSYRLTLNHPNFSGPYHTTTDNRGNAYVVNGSNQIFMFDAQGHYVKILGQNVDPTFVNGIDNLLMIDQDAPAVDLKDWLSVSDPDADQTMTWSITAAPAHGTLSFEQNTAPSGGADIAPAGPITYKPDHGYFGTERFTIEVSDGAGGKVSRTFNILVKPKADKPTASPSSGTVVPNNSSIDLNSSSYGTQIHFTQDGTDPTLQSPIGNRVTVNGSPGETITIKAIAEGPNLVTSDIATFTYTIESPVPTHLTAEAGSGGASLAWNPAEGAVTYSVYQSTESGVYGSSPVAIVDGTAYHAVGLTNGKTYYFTVKANFEASSSDYSNEVSVTPLSNNADVDGLVLKGIGLNPAFAPDITHYTASVDNYVSSITVKTGVADDVYGTVTASVYGPSGLLASGPYVFEHGEESPELLLEVGVNKVVILVTARDGSTKTYTVAVNRAEAVPSPGPDPDLPDTDSPGSDPDLPDTGSPAPGSDSGSSDSSNSGSHDRNKTNSGGGSISKPTAAVSSGLQIIVDGQPYEQIVESTKTNVNGRSVLTVSVDTAKLVEQLQQAKGQPTVTIPAGDGADSVSVVLKADAVKAMQDKQTLLDVQTQIGSYKLPADQIHIGKLSSELGESVKLSDIVIQIEVGKSNEDTVKRVENAAVQDGFTVTASPVHFQVSASANGKTVNVEQFNSYVKREIALPAGIDPSRVTTAVVVNQDGSVHHVPTAVTVRDGKYYAVVNSLTNGDYTLIWNSKTFDDVTGHWSEQAVNDMASRMIVKGVDAERYQPNASVTRAEFAAIVVRALGLGDQADINNKFTDVSEEDWYAGAVARAAEYSLINGYNNGAFLPDQTVTRQEALVIIDRAMKFAGADTGRTNAEASLSAFADREQIAPWADEAIATAVSHGLVKGSNQSLMPIGNLTRAETAAIVQRFLIKTKLIDDRQSK